MRGLPGDSESGENPIMPNNYIIDVVFHVGTEMERFEREFRFFVEHCKRIFKPIKFWIKRLERSF